MIGDSLGVCFVVVVVVVSRGGGVLTFGYIIFSQQGDRGFDIIRIMRTLQGSGYTDYKARHNQEISMTNGCAELHYLYHTVLTCTTLHYTVSRS